MNDKANDLLQKLEAAKAHVANAEAQLDLICPKMKIATVTSVPLCGWNPHWGCQDEALGPFIREGFIQDKLVVYGAWWDHSICNAIEDLVERGFHWILTMDYDSMFTADHVSALFHRMGSNDQIDAIAPLQVRRGSEETAIAGKEGGGEFAFDAEAIQCDTAHFGLTLLRVDAIQRLFAYLKARTNALADSDVETAARVLDIDPKQIRGMTTAMMLHVPDPNGSYRTANRLDPDIYFWKRWKEAGNSLYLDPHVCIGHLQPMVSEMYRDVDTCMKARHVHFMDWRHGTHRARVVQEVAA